MHGLLIGTLAFFCYSLADCCLKFAGKSSLPISQIIFLVAFGSAALLAAPSILRKRELSQFRPSNWKLILFFGLNTCLGSTANVVAFTSLPLSTVYIAYFTCPLIISLVGWLYLKEQMGKERLTYICVGFVGIFIALDPFATDISDTNVWTLSALLSLPFIFTFHSIVLRKLSATETPQVLTCIPPITRSLVFMPFAIYYWQPMSLEQTIFIGLICITASLGHRLLTLAYHRAPATIVAPTQYIQLIYGASFGYLFWQDIPTAHVLIGGVIIAGAGLAAGRLAKRQAMPA